jgi:hypothetical protein
MSDIIAMWCLCGAQVGYPHKSDCPWPYYGHARAMEEKWLADRKRLRQLAEEQKEEDACTHTTS